MGRGRAEQGQGQGRGGEAEEAGEKSRRAPTCVSMRAMVAAASASSRCCVSAFLRMSASSAVPTAVPLAAGTAGAAGWLAAERLTTRLSVHGRAPGSCAATPFAGCRRRPAARRAPAPRRHPPTALATPTHCASPPPCARCPARAPAASADCLRAGRGGAARRGTARKTLRRTGAQPGGPFALSPGSACAPSCRLVLTLHPYFAQLAEELGRGPPDLHGYFKICRGGGAGGEGSAF